MFNPKKFQNHNQYTSVELCLCVHHFACTTVFDKFHTTNVVFTIEISNIRTQVSFLDHCYESVQILSFVASSNTSHPGYDIHFLLIYAMVVYTLILITSDLLFFYFTLYIAFRYDLIQQLVGKLGNIKTEFDTPEKQSSLLESILTLHSDNMRLVALVIRF